MPSLRSPQVCPALALTWMKTPAGGLAWPLSLFPQQATVPSLRSPQVWKKPALTARAVGVVLSVKVAVTLLAASIATVQVAPSTLQQGPLQKVKMEPAAGAAVRVTSVPIG